MKTMFPSVWRIAGGARLLGVAAVIALTFAVPALAGTISIDSSMRSKEVDGRMGFEVTVTNKGDEAAKNVQVHVDLLGQKSSGQKWETLGQGESQSEVFFFETLPGKPGMYPVLVTIDFADLNLYPFTALNVGGLQVGQTLGQAQIFSKSEPLEFNKSGALRLTVKNQEDVKKTVHARVLAPRELDVKPATFEFEIEGMGRHDAKIDVENFSALPGAGYPIYVVFEYDQAGSHFSMPLVTPVKITQGGLTAGSRNTIVIIGAAVVLLVVLVEVVRRFRKA